MITNNNFLRVLLCFRSYFFFLFLFLLFSCQQKENKTICNDCQKEQELLGSDPSKYAEAVENLGKCAKKTNCYTALFHYSHNKAHLMITEGKTDSAVFWSNKALQLAIKKNAPKDIAWAKTKLGQTYSDLEDYSKALKYYHDALDTYQSLNDTFNIAVLNYEIGFLHVGIGQEEEALHFYTIANNKIQLTKNHRVQGIIASSLASIYEFKNEYKKALPLMEGAINAFSEAKNQKANVYKHQLDYYAILSKLNQAPSIDTILKKAKQYEDFASIEADPIAYCATLSTISKLLVSVKLHDKSLVYLKKSREIIEKYELVKDISNNDLGFATYYEQKKDYQKCAYYQKSYIDSLQNKQNAESTLQVNRLNAFYETEKKEAQIVALNAQDNYKTKLLYGLGLGLLLMSLALATIFYQYRRLKNASTTIQTQSNKLTTLMRELHHRVKNNLQIVSSLLNLQSYRLADTDALQALKESKLRVDAMSFIHQRLYQTDDVSNLDIKSYITDLCESLMRAYGYSRDSFDLKIDVPQTNLNVDNAIPIGLILNELVTNSFKYAYKGVANPHLYVSFTNENKPTLTVRDNGTTFSEAEWRKPSMSFGKQLINSLSKQINAKVEILINNGTEFRIVLPNLAYAA